MADIKLDTTIPQIVASLETRAQQIHSREINLREFKVVDNLHFTIPGLDLYVDAKDAHPVKQLCSQIGMSYGFFQKNPSALNEKIFETHLRDIEPATDARAGEERKRDKGERVIRYRTHSDGRNQLLAILPTNHMVMPYIDVIRPVAEALPSDAIIRSCNYDFVDQDHLFTLKASMPSMGFEVADRDPLEMGMFLDLSEDGKGSRMKISGMIYRLVCSNGATTTYNSHPYFEYNYRGIRPADLGSAISSAVSRFGSDLEFTRQRCLESKNAIISISEMEAFMRDLENRRNVSAGFIRKVRRELTAKTASRLTRWDMVNEITLQAQGLPHESRMQHELLGGQLLGLNFKS